MGNKIKLYFKIIKRIIILFIKRKSNNMKLRFYPYNKNKWYVELGWWPFKKEHLEMVAGSADFLDYLADGYNHVKRVIITYQINKNKVNLPGYYECERVSSKLLKGAFYTVNLDNFKTKLYLCPVTLFVLGHYPKYIYIRKDVFVERSPKGYNINYKSKYDNNKQ